MKTLEEYIAMDYDIVIIRVRDRYHVYSPDLDSFVFYGVGETRVEAIEDFESCREEMTSWCLEDGLNVPEPTRRESAPVKIKLEMLPTKQGDND